MLYKWYNWDSKGTSSILSTSLQSYLLFYDWLQMNSDPNLILTRELYYPMETWSQMLLVHLLVWHSTLQICEYHCFNVPEITKQIPTHSPQERGKLEDNASALSSKLVSAYKLNIQVFAEFYCFFDSYISYLPLAHIYERFNQVLVAYFGSAVGFYQGVWDSPLLVSYFHFLGSTTQVYHTYTLWSVRFMRKCTW